MVSQKEADDKMEKELVEMYRHINGLRCYDDGPVISSLACAVTGESLSCDIRPFYVFPVSERFRLGQGIFLREIGIFREVGILPNEFDKAEEQIRGTSIKTSFPSYANMENE